MLWTDRVWIRSRCQFSLYANSRSQSTFYVRVLNSGSRKFNTWKFSKDVILLAFALLYVHCAIKVGSHLRALCDKGWQSSALLIWYRSLVVQNFGLKSLNFYWPIRFNFWVATKLNIFCGWDPFGCFYGPVLRSQNVPWCYGSHHHSLNWCIYSSGLPTRNIWKRVVSAGLRLVSYQLWIDFYKLHSDIR